MDRSRWSRWTDLGGHDAPIRVVTMLRRTQLAVFDIDGPQKVVSEDWRIHEAVKLYNLRRAHPALFVYHTAGGYRIIGRLPAPFLIATVRDAQRWAIQYVGWCEYLLKFRIVADTACKDWTRLYRLPFVVRDGVAQDHKIKGDASNVGEWGVVMPDIFAPLPIPEIEVPLPTFSGEISDAVSKLSSYRDRHAKGDEKARSKADLVSRILQGKALTDSAGTSGCGRHHTVYRAAQVLAFVLPSIGPVAAAELLRPSIEAIGNLAPMGLEHYLQKARVDYLSGRTKFDQMQAYAKQCTENLANFFEQQPRTL